MDEVAEALNSVYKAEPLIDRKVWSGLIKVIAETSKWVAWYNQERLHSAIDYRPPFEVRSEWINQSVPSGSTSPRQSPRLLRKLRRGASTKPPGLDISSVSPPSGRS
ncbi:MAG: integrase core domain-containing protein [Brevibacterium linens]